MINGTVRENYDLLLEHDARDPRRGRRAGHGSASPRCPASGSRTSSASTRTSRRSARPRRSCAAGPGSSCRPTTPPARARRSRTAASAAQPRCCRRGRPRCSGWRCWPTRSATCAGNRTRFVVDRRPGGRLRPPLGRSWRPCRRTTIVVAVRNEPGTLLAVLRVVADHGLNMRKLESRPSRERPWEYVFWIDLDGDAGEPAMAAALDGLGRVTTMDGVLGSYPTPSPSADAGERTSLRSRSCRPCTSSRRPRSAPCRTGRSSPRRRGASLMNG